MSSRACFSADETGNTPNHDCSDRCLDEVPGWDLEGANAVSTGLGNCSGVSVTRRLSQTGGVVGGDDVEAFWGKMLVSLRIKFPRMFVTSDSTGE